MAVRNGGRGGVVGKSDLSRLWGEVKSGRRAFLYHKVELNQEEQRQKKRRDEGATPLFLAHCKLLLAATSSRCPVLLKTL